MSDPPPHDDTGAKSPVTVFGGTGFLGRRVVQHLLRHGFPVRIAVRRPQAAAELFGSAPRAIETMDVDVRNERQVAAALAGALAAVNAVSLYRERGPLTYRAIHVDAARRIARQAREQGLARLVHVSGIGADATSDSAYISARGLGDAAVQEELPTATVVRSAVMFGPDDAFLTTLVALLRRLPVVPLFGKGGTLLQPVHVENVGAAVAAIVNNPDNTGRSYDLGGPETLSYAALLRRIGAEIKARPVLLPMPFPVWLVLAAALDVLPNPPVTRNQIELMEIDTVAAPDAPGLASLGISPLDLWPTLREIIAAGR